VHGSASATQSSSAGLPRILCLGDSLTEGYHRIDGAVQMHPYALRLTQLLGGHSVVLEESGVSGEVTISMVRRLKHLLAAAVAEGRPYSLVVLLGGTNDTCHGISADRIAAQIRSLHALCHLHSPVCHTLALTVPDIAQPQPRSAHTDIEARELDVALLDLNARIRRGFQTSAATAAAAAALSVAPAADGFDAARFHVLDLQQMMPQWEAAPTPCAPGTLPRADPQKWWDADRVHFTPKGYDHIAQLIAQAVQQHQLLPAARPQPPASEPADKPAAAGCVAS
jgi:lysophospholipase L1-like esterase